MDVSQAQRIIESLRKGIPPDGFVRHFTVGRKAEIDDLIHQRLPASLNVPRGSGTILTVFYLVIRHNSLSIGKSRKK